MAMHIHLQPFLMSIALASTVVCVSSVFAQNNKATSANAQAQQGGRETYDANDPAPDAQGDALSNLDRIGFARPNNQTTGEPPGADGDETLAPVRRIARPARRGTAIATAGAAKGAQKPDALNRQQMPATVMYGNPYGNLYGAGRGPDLYRTPW